MTAACRFLNNRLKSRRALANDQRKAIGIENPLIVLETESFEAMSQAELQSPRSLSSDVEMASSPRLDQSEADASKSPLLQTESIMEYEFETA
jgi:hypothetical protein